MYDPLQNDNYNEWVELYNPTNQSINITGWVLCDNYAEDLIEGDFDNGNGTAIIPPYNYAVIADHGTKIYENFSIPEKTIRLFVDDKSIGNGLGNSGDKLVLKNSTNVTIDALEWINNYSDVPGIPIDSVEEGYTISRFNNSDVNDSIIDFYEGIIPTPGQKNIFIPGKHRITFENEKTSYYIKKNKDLKISLIVKNSGYFSDNITLKINEITNGWLVYPQQKIIYLKPNETQDISLLIIPCQRSDCKSSTISISAISEKDFGIPDEITMFFEILAPDLEIRRIKLYNEQGKENNTSGQGEIIRIKAFLKNFGTENATNVFVRFYYDFVDEKHFIGSKYYDSVSKYQKYPSVKWDTTNIESGNHTIIVLVDEENFVDELDETNNKLITNVKLFNTNPSKTGEKILISEVYYHSHPGLYNEYVALFNPSIEECNISGWYLTNNPVKRKTDQTKIIFPENTTITGNSCLYVSENAQNYFWETGKKPDFEYNTDSDEKIPQMISSKKFIMSNKGCMISLKDIYNHTIDLISYGQTNDNISFWNGSSVNESGEGVILKRNFDVNGFPVDTNSSKDWINPRKYVIGQSNFPYINITFNGEVQTFVSPDNSYRTIVNELKKANKSVYFNIYEFTNPFLCDHLVKVIRRNVSVYIFLEGSPVGGISDEEKFLLNRIVTYGGNVRFLINNAENDVYARYPFNHGKYLIIDNKTVIVESCNWAKTGIPINPTYGNREWGIIIRNSNVAEYFVKVFLDDWNPKRCDSYSYYDLNFSLSSNFIMDKTVYKGVYNPEFESDIFIGNFSIKPVLSPDISYQAVVNLIESAKDCIYIEQLYIYKNWEDQINPFVEKIVKKAKQGIDIRVLLNYNPSYDNANLKNNETKQYLEENGIKVKFVYTNWSYFTNIHNKGIIVDNTSVLISSINWNENSVTSNRETGVIIKNEEVAKYYAKIFFYDWNLKAPKSYKENSNSSVKNKSDNYENTIYIVVLFTLTFALIIRDWRNRKWTQ